MIIFSQKFMATIACVVSAENDKNKNNIKTRFTLTLYLVLVNWSRECSADYSRNVILNLVNEVWKLFKNSLTYVCICLMCVWSMERMLAYLGICQVHPNQ